jgi:hypothetical protein
MEKHTVMIAKGLRVSFESSVVTSTTYEACGSNCSSCSGGCETQEKKPPRSLTVHQLAAGILQCESPQEVRTLEAEFVVTDHDGTSEYMALRAFKTDEELRTWVQGMGSELSAVKATLESSLASMSVN